MSFLRPDRVYRTGVLAPMYGYQPQSAVEGVLARFTQGPFHATVVQASPTTDVPAMTVSGISGMGLGLPVARNLNGIGPIQTLIIRVKAAIAARRARKFMGL